MCARETTRYMFVKYCICKHQNFLKLVILYNLICFIHILFGSFAFLSTILLAKIMVSAKRKVIDTKRFLHSTGQLLADQYYHIYNVRLACSREALIRTARFRWGEEVKNVPLEQLNASLGSIDVFVIGTLFKSMPRQPSILRELEGNEQCPNDPNINFTSDDDSLVLHETDENVQVVGDIDVHSHVTGIPVALLGHQLNGGAKFHVTDICYAGPSLSVYRMPKDGERINGSATLKNERLLIVSGFEFGFDSTMSKDESLKVIESLKKLRNLIHGKISHNTANGITNDYKVVRVIIAGNSIAAGYTKAKTEVIAASESKDIRSLNEVFRLFDKYLFDLAQSGAGITIMPGKNDPTSFLLPQQPFHPKILPQSGLLENVFPVTNPCLIEHGHYIILGTAGENIEAIRQHSKIEYSTTILKNTLEWGHIAPSAPDNLSCLPFKDRDPFIIDYVPDIYFAGNQHEYAVTTYSTETKPKIQLISVPSFVKSQSCVLVDLSNLECELVNFN